MVGPQEQIQLMKNSKITRYVRRGLAAAVVAGAGLTFAGPGAQAADASTWDALAQCESGGNWNTNTGNGFSGGLQFTPSTWAAYGGTGSPENASREQQIAVAEKVLAGQGWGAWPACSAKLGLSGGATGVTSAAPEVTTQSQYVAPEQTVPAAPVETYTPVETYVPETPVQEVAPAPTYTEPAPAAAAPVEVPASSLAPAAPVQAPAVSGDTYTIQAGDTLSSIADKLGIAGGWQALYAANAGTIVHPDLIFTGEVLQLPA